MVNDTQIVFQYFPVGRLKGVLGKIYLDKIGAYVNGKTADIHSNEGGGKLGYISILNQPRVYATQSGSTAFPVPNKSRCNCGITKCQFNGSHYISNNKSIRRKNSNLEGVQQRNASSQTSHL